MDAKNIVYTSRWDNYPAAATVPLTGKAQHAYLLMAGSTNPMQSHFTNGVVLVKYKDGPQIHSNWWTLLTGILLNRITWWMAMHLQRALQTIPALAENRGVCKKYKTQQH